MEKNNIIKMNITSRLIYIYLEALNAITLKLALKETDKILRIFFLWKRQTPRLSLSK